MGDHWERGYGDLEWRGLCYDRILPWYFLAYDGIITYGYGVKVQPNAFCSFSMDEKVMKIVYDIRCGGEGVLLRGRNLFPENQ